MHAPRWRWAGLVVIWATGVLHDARLTIVRKSDGLALTGTTR